MDTRAHGMAAVAELIRGGQVAVGRTVLQVLQRSGVDMNADVDVVLGNAGSRPGVVECRTR